MTKPILFNVEVSGNIMVLAESKQKAIDIAERCVDFQDDCISFDVQEVTCLSDVPKEWHDCLPYFDFQIYS